MIVVKSVFDTFIRVVEYVRDGEVSDGCGGGTCMCIV